MKFTLFFFVLCVSIFTPVHAQSDLDLIGAAIQKYIDGTSFNDPDLIQEAFYEEAFLFLSKEGEEIWLMPMTEYAGGFNRGARGEPNGRLGKILSIEQLNDIAFAKAEIEIPARGMKFIDLFILKRLSSGWKIISKAATRLE